jgi:hypothetical protein
VIFASDNLVSLLGFGGLRTQFINVSREFSAFKESFIEEVKNFNSNLSCTHIVLKNQTSEFVTSFYKTSHMLDTKASFFGREIESFNKVLCYINL